MENIILMKNSTIKGGIFSKSLREIMAETKKRARGLWYKAGARYSSMPTFKLKMSKNPMLRSFGSIAERYGVRIVAGAALATIGIGGIELLMHPEMAFAAEDATLDNDTLVGSSTVDGNEMKGTVTEVADANATDAVANEKTTQQTPFAADASAKKSDDFEDYSNVDYHLGKDGKPILDYHYDDEGNVVIDASDEEIAEKMQEFKDGNKETEPPTHPTEPPTHPTEPPTHPTEPETTPKTEPQAIPQTGDDALNKAFGFVGMAVIATSAIKTAVNKIFKADRVTSSSMHVGVVSGRPTYENISYVKYLR